MPKSKHLAEKSSRMRKIGMAPISLQAEVFSIFNLLIIFRSLFGHKNDAVSGRRSFQFVVDGSLCNLPSIVA